MKTERLLLAATVGLVVPAGLFVKFGVSGPLREWAFRYGAAMLYEVFWILLLRLLFRRVAPAATALGVCVATCILETLQLWKPPWLQAIRRTFAGGILLGTTFDAVDFLYYVLGSLLGYLILRGIVSWSSRFRNGSARGGEPS
ncbi:MAG: DUF2809 domain-containing protein [Phycisphaerae bacterium]